VLLSASRLALLSIGQTTIDYQDKEMTVLLENKVAVIYGGGGAVGGAVARAFAREGARLFLAGRTSTPLSPWPVRCRWPAVR
jgi:hypothetical protein